MDQLKSMVSLLGSPGTGSMAELFDHKVKPKPPPKQKAKSGKGGKKKKENEDGKISADRSQLK